MIEDCRERKDDLDVNAEALLEATATENEDLDE